jgi:hypothetical protein
MQNYENTTANIDSTTHYPAQRPQVGDSSGLIADTAGWSGAAGLPLCPQPKRRRVRLRHRAGAIGALATCWVDPPLSGRRGATRPGAKPKGGAGEGPGP